MQADHTSELRACFRRSYDDVLKHHHGWLVQSAVTVRVGNARLSAQTCLYFYFPPSGLVVPPVGHHGHAVPIRVLQADIAGGFARETRYGIGKMAERAQPDRRPHEALPPRRWLWYGIESGTVRRLSSFVIHFVDHAFPKPFTRQGEMMMLVFVGANRPRTLNIPRPGIDSRLRGRPLSWPTDICLFVSDTFNQSKILISLEHTPIYL